VKQWHEKYRDKGLVVVGVHTPEYPQERSTANVAAALKRFDIRYPVAQDNRYATWEAYRNQFWPAVYLIDKSGKIVYSHFGEGQYEQTEATIQRLLAQPG
jgi:glutathione peroxidase-family protein